MRRRIVATPRRTHRRERLPTCFAAAIVLLPALAVFALLALARPSRGEAGVALGRSDFLVLFRKETASDACGTGTIVVRIVHKVRNDADAAAGGGAWANDSYERSVTIVEVAPPVPPSGGTYCAVTRYTGGFVSDGVKSPGATGSLAAGIRGTLAGGYRSLHFTGTLDPSPSQPRSGNLGTIDYGCDPLTDPGDGSSCRGAFDVLSTYFLSASGFGLEWWGWRYVTPGSGVWQNACDGPGPECPGTVGDITN